MQIIDLCTDSRGKSSHENGQSPDDVGWQAGPNIDFKIIASVLNPMLQHSLERVIVRRKPERLCSFNDPDEVPDVWHAWEYPEIIHLQQQLTGAQCPACLEQDAPRCSGRNCGCRDEPRHAEAPHLVRMESNHLVHDSTAQFHQHAVVAARHPLLVHCQMSLSSPSDSKSQIFYY